MVYPRGFEPLASTSAGLRSIQLSYGYILLPKNTEIVQTVNEVKAGMEVIKARLNFNLV